MLCLGYGRKRNVGSSWANFHSTKVSAQGAGGEALVLAAFPDARYHIYYCICFILLDSHSSAILFPFYRWGNWGPRKWKHLPKVRQLRKQQSWDLNPETSDPEAPELTPVSYWLDFWSVGECLLCYVLWEVLCTNDLIFLTLLAGRHCYYYSHLIDGKIQRLKRNLATCPTVPLSGWVQNLHLGPPW